MDLASQVQAVASEQEIGDILARSLLDEDRDRVAWHTAQQIRRLEAQIARRERQRKAITDELDWSNGRDQEQIERLSWVMEAIALAERERGHKSYGVPGVGTWSTRTVPPSIAIQDREALMEAIIDRGLADELVQVRESVDTSAVRAYVERTGELLPGTARRPERISVSYKLTPEE